MTELLTRAIKESEEIEAKATPGPWVIDETIWAIEIEGGGKNHYPVTWVNNLKNYKKDAFFIAHSRNELHKFRSALKIAVGALDAGAKYANELSGFRGENPMREALAEIEEVFK